MTLGPDFRPLGLVSITVRVKTMGDQRGRTNAAVMAARGVIEGMPAHVRALAGQYVGPVVVALLEVNAELSALADQIESLKRGGQ